MPTQAFLLALAFPSKSRDTALQRPAEEPWHQAGKWLRAASGSTLCSYPSRPFSGIGASASVAGPERRKVHLVLLVHHLSLSY